jgi:long-chain acyl-CoA synthetase
MRGDGRQREQIVDLLVGRRIDSGRACELPAPLHHFVRYVSHLSSLPCDAVVNGVPGDSDAVTLTEDELIDRGMATAVYAAAAPDRMAVISSYGDRTFRELNERANQVVRGLRRLGAQRGDTVALVCRNRPEFVEVYEAVLRGAFRLTPINWHLTAEEIAYIIDDSEAVVLVGDAFFGDTLVATAKLLTASPVLLAIDGEIDGFASYEAALDGEDRHNIDDPEPGGAMLYTSGTTGRPKGVRRAMGMAPGLYRLHSRNSPHAGETNRSLVTGPLYHAAPLGISLTAPLAAGLGLVLMDGWSPEETLELIERHGITHTHLVPIMFHRLLSLPDSVKARHDTSSLRLVLHGAAPCPVDVKRRMIEWWGPVIEEYYAATEGGGTYITAKEWLERPGSVGKATPGSTVVVRTETSEPAAPGEVGTVWFKRSEIEPFEYHRDPAKTASVHDGDFFTLGDMGYMDDDGYVFLTGRTAELIISGGVNIYPAEIDAVLLEHPAVRDAACVGVPDEEWGETVKAVVEVREGVVADDALAAELLGFCRDRLAHFKCPRSVDFDDTLPRFETGKIYRRLVRDRYWPSAT